MLNAGISVKQVAEITGWSTSLINKIKKGNYYELKEKKRKAAIEKRTQVDESAEKNADDEESLKDLLKAINKKLACIILNMGSGYTIDKEKNIIK